MGEDLRTGGKWSAWEDSLLSQGEIVTQKQYWQLDPHDEAIGLGVQTYGTSWELVATALPRRTAKMCKNRWEQHLNTGLNKGQFTEQEDRIIIDAVGTGITKWSQIAKMLENRIGKQCRERWFNHLDPQLKKTPWTDEEDSLLIAAQSRLGNSWTKIALELSGRSENEVKNRWNSAPIRRRLLAMNPSADQGNVYPSSDTLSAGSTASKSKPLLLSKTIMAVSEQELLYLHLANEYLQLVISSQAIDREIKGDSADKQLDLNPSEAISIDTRSARQDNLGAVSLVHAVLDSNASFETVQLKDIIGESIDASFDVSSNSKVATKRRRYNEEEETPTKTANFVHAMTLDSVDTFRKSPGNTSTPSRMWSMGSTLSPGSFIDSDVAERKLKVNDGDLLLRDYERLTPITTLLSPLSLPSWHAMSTLQHQNSKSNDSNSPPKVETKVFSDKYPSQNPNILDNNQAERSPSSLGLNTEDLEALGEGWGDTPSA